MKVLVLTSVYKDNSLGNKDTSTNIVNSFAIDWAKQGHDVLVIHNSHCYPTLIHLIPSVLKKKLASKMAFSIADYKAVKKKNYMDKGVKVVRLPIKKYIPHSSPSKSAIEKQIQRIKTVLEINRFTPDVITGHWASPQLEIISQLKETYNCKTAVVLHGTGYINSPKFNAKAYLNSIDKLGCRSKSQALQIKRILQLEELPFVCYSGVPDDYVSRDNVSLEKFDAIRKWKFIYVGRLVKYKNIDTTIKALAQLTNIDWEFDIVGDGAALEQLKSLSVQLGCDERVHFWGRIPRAEAIDLMSRAHVFVMVSTNEIFGLVYLEAMASKCITIASKDGGVDGIILNGYNGFLSTQGDVEQLIDLLNYLTTVELDDLKTISQNGYETATKYKDSIVAEKYLSVISE